MGLLHSRSRSQRRFIMSVNVWLNDIFSMCPIVYAQPFFFFLIQNLIWWCIIMRQCVMQKNCFIIFNFKVTARAYIIKIWLFLLNLLNCWSVCNKTWFDSTECPVEKWDYCIQSEGHSKGSQCQWIIVLIIFSLCVQLCLLSPEPRNHFFFFYQTLW